MEVCRERFRQVNVSRAPYYESVCGITIGQSGCETTRDCTSRYREHTAGLAWYAKSNHTCASELNTQYINGMRATNRHYVESECIELAMQSQRYRFTTPEPALEQHLQLMTIYKKVMVAANEFTFPIISKTPTGQPSNSKIVSALHIVSALQGHSLPDNLDPEVRTSIAAFHKHNPNRGPGGVSRGTTPESSVPCPTILCGALSHPPNFRCLCGLAH